MSKKNAQGEYLKFKAPIPSAASRMTEVATNDYSAERP
jgi:hypothetical protein